jgi:hypothetical protein
VKKFLISVWCGVGLVATSAAGLAQQVPNVNGTWTIQQTGANGTTTSTVTLQQSGKGIVGSNAASKTGFTGEFASNDRIDGKWHGPGGAGWLTIYVSPNGHSFNGTWGYNGRAANGSFVGNKVLPPSPITAAGTWNITGAGGPTMFVGAMKCTESGGAVVCHSGSVVINGKFRAKDKVRARWTSPNGSGWFSFWFNEDNNSFNGIWGNGADTTPPVGRVVGQRSLEG